MTLLEIEQLLSQLQQQINSNTAAINTLINTISNYATTDDLHEIAKKINDVDIQNKNISTDLNALKMAVENSDHLNKLIDVEINDLTEGDILQYGSTGKWHNIQVDLTGTTGSTSITKLTDLSDVQVNSPSDGQSLVYNAYMNMWTNVSVSNGGGSGGGDYLTKSVADTLYLSLKGGTIDGNLLVKGGITAYSE